MNSHFLGPARVVQIPEGSVDDTVLQRYEILQTGKLADVPEAATIIAERTPVDNQYDTRLRVGKYWFGVATGPDAYSQDNLFQDGKPVTK
jgi:hypothetical protein